jgi:chromosome segregation ATPase
MELELKGWKVKTALIAVAVLVVAVPLARASMSNKGRAEDWHRRAIVAEESVAGLRAVIVERSRALNRRTIQANQLAARLESNGSALRRTKASVGALTRRQRQLATSSARLEKERNTLQARVSSLRTLGARLDVCAKLVASGETTGKKKTPAAKSAAAAQAESCAKASSRFDAYMRQSG